MVCGPSTMAVSISQPSARGAVQRGDVARQQRRRTAARSRNCRCRRSSPSGGTPVVSWARAGMARARAASHPSTRVAGPRLPRRLRQVKRKRGPEFPRYLAGARRGGAELPWSQPAAWPRTRRCMGTAKYDHPGYVADTGDAGKYHVGIWCPHGYPAHIHIGRPADGGDPWRCCAYRTACSSRWPTIPRRCAGGRSDRRWARACCAPWRWTATTRRSVSNSTPSLGRPHAGGGPDELPTAVVEKPWDSRCACVNSDVITRAWRRRSISVRSGARSCSPPHATIAAAAPAALFFFPRHDSATLLRISVPVPP